jgi:plasmid stabilization system protein ParE
MKLQWSRPALADLTRLHAVLSPINAEAATATVRMLRATAERLRDVPHIGEEIGSFDGYPSRRLVVGTYELWYEVHPSTVVILRVWHTRQRRSL